MNVDNDGAPATFAPAFISEIVDAALLRRKATRPLTRLLGKMRRGVLTTRSRGTLLLEKLLAYNVQGMRIASARRKPSKTVEDL